MANDYRTENVLKHAVDVFERTIAVKVEQFRRLVPKMKDLTNSEVTGDFIEEVVRGFVRQWISPSVLLNGTLHSAKDDASSERPMQIDGIVYRPDRGPTVMTEGGFAIVHPAFCSNVIEIKMAADISALKKRLDQISGRYMSHVPADHVMGIVIQHSDPEKASQISVGKGKTVPSHRYDLCQWCPIFILFKETRKCELIPHRPAIEAMIRCIYRNRSDGGNYL
jgi:hypothetical protein